MKKILNIIIGCMFLGVNAQNNEAIEPNSSILNTSDLNVDHSTGVPDIGINLFEIPTINPNFRLNLKINYDLYSNISAIYTTNQIGDAWRISIAPRISRYSTRNKQNFYSLTDEIFLENNVVSSIPNNNNDLFSYEIFGLSGKFRLNFVNNNVSIEIIEQSDFAKIEVDTGIIEISEYALKFKTKSFTITDKNGFKYLFSFSDNYNFVPANLNNYAGLLGKYPTDFHLTKITDKNHNVLCEYEYEEHNSRKNSNNTIRNERYKLKKITVNKIGVIDFQNSIYGNETITLKNTKNSNIKKIDFKYFHGSGSGYSKKLLNSIEITDGSSANPLNYIFSYTPNLNTNAKLNQFGFMYLPDNCAESEVSNYKENMVFNHNVLKKIKYPNGASTFFDFEQNDYFEFIYSQNVDLYKEKNSENFIIQDLPLVHDPLNNRYILNVPNNGDPNISVYIKHKGYMYQRFPNLPGSDIEFNDPFIYPSLKIHAYNKNALILIDNVNSRIANLQKTESECFLGAKFNAKDLKFTLVYDKDHLNEYTSITAKIKVFKTENIKEYLYSNGLKIKKITTFDTDISLANYEKGNYTEPKSEQTFNYRMFDNPNKSSGRKTFLSSISFNYVKNIISYENVSIKTSGLGEIQYTFLDRNSILETDDDVYRSYANLSFTKKLPSKIVKKDENGNVIEENIFSRKFAKLERFRVTNSDPIITYEKVINRNYVNGNTGYLEMITESNFDTLSRNLTSRKITNPSLNETFEEKYTFVKHNDAYLPKTVNKFKNGIALNRSENFYTGVLYQNNIVRINYNLTSTQIAKANLPLEIEKEFTRYLAGGQLIEYKTKDGVYVSQIWGYNGAFVIAELHDIKYENIDETILNNLVSKANETDSNNEAAIRDLVKDLRIKHPQVKIKSYTYNPLIGITSMTDVNGINEFYEYDSFNRLYRIKDHNNLILKEYKYNYKNQ